MLQNYPFTINAPGSIANMGPGFDAIAAAISLKLTIKVEKSNCFKILYLYKNSTLPLEFDKNLITQTAYLVSKAYKCEFPTNLQLTVVNDIPIGMGFGSSSAAIVSGIYLANYICNLYLTSSEILNIASIIEGHPDNVAACVYGGIRTCLLINDDYYQNHLDYKNLIKSDIYNIDGESLRKIFNINYVITKEIAFSSQIKLIALIPDKTLKTENSRSILPSTYSKDDVIYNLQRLNMLCLSFQNPDPITFYRCLQDRLHQPYRNEIIPGLNDVLSVNPLDLPGLLGTCLSGAGPSIIAFIICNENNIGDKLCKIYKEKSNNNCEYLLIKFTQLGIYIHI